ncbi:hypothetical protein [Fodinicola acaciae]|uniref:hypothetical protein n=1 Tax=Fodinicola acaciae TaxID=2681555 RepID=UPI0013D86CD3|nr:hypothetical protein [Fodinicola acaciae]
MTEQTPTPDPTPAGPRPIHGTPKSQGIWSIVLGVGLCMCGVSAANSRTGGPLSALLPLLIFTGPLIGVALAIAGIVGARKAGMSNTLPTVALVISAALLLIYTATGVALVATR